MSPEIARARDELRYRDVLGLVEQALPHAATVEQRASLEVLRAEAMRVLGVDGARAAADAAVALAETVGGACLVDALYEHVNWDDSDARSRALARAVGIADALKDARRGVLVRVRLAGDQMARGDPRVAAATLDDAAALGADDAGYEVVRGYVARYLGRPDDAREHFLRAAAAPGSRHLLARARAATGLGELELLAGRAEPALRHLSEAITLLEGAQGVFPALAGAWTARGEAARALGRFDEARDCYVRTLALNTRGTTADMVRLNLALIDLETGRSEDARRGFHELRDRPATFLRAIARLGESACAATAGDEATFDDAFAPWVAGLGEDIAELDAAVLARRCAEAALPRGGPWLARAARAAAIAVEQWPKLGRAGEAERDARTLWTLASAGAPIPLGPFLLERRIGRGHFADVWAASHDSGTRVAVKVLRRSDPERAAVLEHELRVVAGLDHAHVVRLLHHGRVGRGAMLMQGELAEGTPWFATELAAGTLDGHLGAWPWERVREALLALLDALGHAHARGVLHLDVKPANVLLGEDGRVLLADFGIARARGAEAVFAGGTAAYAAPEQFGGDPASFGPETDLYALGCLAAALVAGAPPFAGADAVEIGRAKLGGDPAFRPVVPVPSGLRPWISTLLARDPARRFRRAADTAESLRALGESCPRLRPGVPIAWGRERVHRPVALVDAGLGLFGLRRPPFVGREAERALLWKALRAVHDERRARLVRLEAEPGHGATALGRWLCERAHELGAAELATDPDALPDGGGRAIVLWADDPAPELVRRLQLRVGDPLPLLLVHPIRPSDEPPDDLDALDLVLGPLPADDHHALIDALLPLAPEVREHVAAVTRGHPGFTVALVGELVARHRLAFGPDGYGLRPSPEEPLEVTAAAVWKRVSGGVQVTG